jgi:hypothetical protein
MAYVPHREEVSRFQKIIYKTAAEQDYNLSTYYRIQINK